MKELPSFVQTFAHFSAGILEVLGIGVIILYAVYALVAFLLHTRKTSDRHQHFQEGRHRIARGILLGLEFLVGADIIMTVAIDFTFSSVGVLAIIVLIRTFLSYSLELEISGKFPWQRE